MELAEEERRLDELLQQQEQEFAMWESQQKGTNKWGQRGKAKQNVTQHNSKPGRTKVFIKEDNGMAKNAVDKTPTQDTESKLLGANKMVSPGP